MLFEWAIAPWLLAGLGLGALFTVLVAGAFLAGERWFPAPEQAAASGPDSGETRRRGEIRDYLDRIGEIYTEDGVVDGFTVAFLLTDRDVAVTFDARAYLGLRDSGVHPILIEHEMPGGALGRRLPFETPDPEPTDETGASADDDRWGQMGEAAADARALAADAERVRAAYATLGLSTDADRETVREAYRDRVKRVHPDQGGDRETFQRLQEAYALAKEDTA